MEIEIPEHLYDYPNTPVECVALSTNYSDGFVLFGRNPNQLSQWQYQQYKLFNGKLYATAKANYSSTVYVPECINTEELVDKPETAIYFGFISFLSCIFTFYVVYHFILRRLMP